MKNSYSAAYIRCLIPYDPDSPLNVHAMGGLSPKQLEKDNN